MDHFTATQGMGIRRVVIATGLVGLVVLALAACAPPAQPLAQAGASPAVEQHTEHPAGEEGALPVLQPANLGPGEKLRIVATTNLIADVVSHVGQERIELTGLVPIGADPHGFQATPSDLRALNTAHLVFVNGLNLEENLLPVLHTLDGGAPVVSVNAAVDTLAMDEEEDGGDHGHDHGQIDPHTWFDIANVVLWTRTIADALSAVDPVNAAAYAEAAAVYTQELAELDTAVRTLLDQVPPEQRKLVTDHDELGYFADAYGFDVVGAVVPSLSTLATASAQDLAALQDQIRNEDVRAVFVGTTVNPSLAAQIAEDTGIRVVPIYTGSLSAPDGPAASYVDMMRYTAQALVDALR